MALPNTNIDVGAPPLLWSDVSEAFQKINDNFTALDLATGGSAVDLSELYTNVSPAEDNTYFLGAPGKSWKSVITSEWSSSPGSEGNGLILGTAQIKGISGTIDLPANSTVNGSLIIDPNKTFFKSVQVDNGNQIVADNFVDTLNLLSGSAIQMTVSSGAESITITNTGVTSAVAGDGISISSATGNITVANTGVRSLTNSGSIGTRTPGSGIHVSSSTGTPLLTNTGVLEIQPGSGSLAVSTDAVTGIVTITNTAPAQPAFQQIEVNGDSASRLIADSTSGIFRIVSGAGITLTKNTGTDTLSITVNPVFDLKGSVFGDDSSILVDAVSNYIYGNVSASTLRTAETKIALGSDAGKTSQSSYAVAIGQEAGKTSQGSLAVSIGYLSGSDSQSNQAVSIGYQAGTTGQGLSGVAIGFEAGKTSQGAYGVSIGHLAGEISQGSQAIAIGPTAGATSQGSSAIAMGYLAGNNTQGTGAIALGYTTAQITQGQAGVAIGWSAGQTNQGAYAIAIGYRAGFTNQNASSIVLNASGSALEAAAAGLYINPIRSSSSAAKALMYNTSTSELFYNPTLEFIGSTISTSDSTGITVDVLTTFNTDVVFENDITVAERLTVKGSRVINLNELKSIVAASTDFATFKTAIAALA